MAKVYCANKEEVNLDARELQIVKSLGRRFESSRDVTETLKKYEPQIPQHCMLFQIPNKMRELLANQVHLPSSPPLRAVAA